MKDEYKLTIRLRLNDERERRLAEYLKSFHESGFNSRNQFVIEAIAAFMDADKKERYLDDIRSIFREEMGKQLQGMQFHSTDNDSPENTKEREQEILEDLKLFE
ncbi:MAG: hypothetical protein IJJ41_05620 [Clostridia bacterium]|nr:hypothetical protein [Clostridia bacterium]MBR0415497.1 hypothetical protein [Clostridia bacterium]